MLALLRPPLPVSLSTLDCFTWDAWVFSNIICVAPPLLPVLFFSFQTDGRIVFLFFHSYLWVYFIVHPLTWVPQDINQLQQIMRLTGTPPASLISRMPSHEVRMSQKILQTRAALERVTTLPHVTLFCLHGSFFVFWGFFFKPFPTSLFSNYCLLFVCNSLT